MNDLQKYKTALSKLISIVEKVISSGEKINEPMKLEIAKTIRALTTKIKQLQKEQPVETLQPQQQPTPQDVKTAGMPSSNVEGFAYDDDSQRLLVRFLGPFPQRNGPIYAYEGVPKAIFELFQAGSIPARTDGQNKWGKWWKGKVPSLGASLYTLIKNRGYPYQRLIG